MSWSTTLGIIADTGLTDLGIAGPPVPADQIGPGRIGAVQAGNHIVLIDPAATGQAITAFATCHGKPATVVALTGTSSADAQLAVVGEVLSTTSLAELLAGGFIVVDPVTPTTGPPPAVAPVFSAPPRNVPAPSPFPAPPGYRGPHPPAPPVVLPGRDISLPDSATFDRETKWLQLEMRNDDWLPPGSDTDAAVGMFHHRLGLITGRIRSGFVKQDLRKAGIRGYKAIEIVVLGAAPPSPELLAAIDRANPALEREAVVVTYRQVGSDTPS